MLHTRRTRDLVYLFLLPCLVACLGQAACDPDSGDDDSSSSPPPVTTPTATPMPNDTPAETPMPTATPVMTPTTSPTPSSTPTTTPSPAPEFTPIESPTPEATPLESPTPEATPLESPTPEATPLESPTPEPSPTPADTDHDGSPDALDCDPLDPSVYPGATETCDDKDNDCDGQIDEGAGPNTYYFDGDGDGYGTTTSTTACVQPENFAAATGDCNDGDATINPGAAEECDGQDNDCDSLIDEEVKPTWYRDQDGDGYGSSTSAIACTMPAGYADQSGDCDDTNSTIHPGASEVCNGKDDSCSGVIDEGVSSTYYQDADADGWGDLQTAIEGCAAPSGYVTEGGDCLDSDPTVFPGADEYCDEKDNNCDGLVDEGVLLELFSDADGDGYGVPGDTIAGCVASEGYSIYDTDCDDASASIYPGAKETCDAKDDDCDGVRDNGMAPK